MRQLPPDWERLATRKGIPPSLRGIAEKADVAVTTLARLVFEGRTSTGTVRKVAEALGISLAEVHRLANVSAGDLGPWDPPIEAHRLSGPARDALSDLIRAIVNQEGGQRDDRQSEAQKSPAGGGVTGGPEEDDGGDAPATTGGGSVHELPRAARTDKTGEVGKRKREADELGTESQDPGGMEPS